MKIKTVHITLVLTGLIILAGVCVYATLPWLVDAYIDAATVPLGNNGRYVILVLMYMVGIPVLTLLCSGFKMLLNIAAERSFIRQNVTLFNLISLCSCISGLMFLAATFFLNSVFPVIIFVVFLLLGLFAKIFSTLFSAAMAYKEENELTI